MVKWPDSFSFYLNGTGVVFPGGTTPSLRPPISKRQNRGTGNKMSEWDYQVYQRDTSTSAWFQTIHSARAGGKSPLPPLVQSVSYILSDGVQVLSPQQTTIPHCSQVTGCALRPGNSRGTSLTLHSFYHGMGSSSRRNAVQVTKWWIRHSTRLGIAVLAKHCEKLRASAPGCREPGSALSSPSHWTGAGWTSNSQLFFLAHQRTLRAHSNLNLRGFRERGKMHLI